MPWTLQHFQQQDCNHFITFSCHQRRQLLSTAAKRDIFELELERVRQWYGLYVYGYVVMPEHVHILVSEPERKPLSVAIQMLKRNVSRKLRRPGEPHFWQKRYYSFPVWTKKKRTEKLRYMHRNPVVRGLVERPEDWRWSSYNHYATGVEGAVEIESERTAGKRERMGVTLSIARKPAHPGAQESKARDKGGAAEVG
jgi:putative transposase